PHAQRRRRGGVLPARAPSRLVLALAWCACVASLYGLPAAAGYRLRDPDSVLHESLASSLAHRPPAEWVAPVWPPGHWGQGVDSEHAACVLWLPALLERAGVSRGALGLRVLPAALAWWAVRSRRTRELWWLAMACGAIAGAAALYESWFRAVTGSPFLRAYLASQFEGIADAERGLGLWHLAIPLYYAVNLFWFALPGFQLFLLGLRRTARMQRAASQRLALTAAGACVVTASLFT